MIPKDFPNYYVEDPENAKEEPELDELVRMDDADGSGEQTTMMPADVDVVGWVDED